MNFLKTLTLALLVPTILLAASGAAVVGGTIWLDRQLEQYFKGPDALAQNAAEMYAQGLQMGQAVRNIVLDPKNGKASENLRSAGEAFDQAHSLAVAADPQAAKTLEQLSQLRSRLAGVQKRVVEQAQADSAAAAQLLNREETPLWREMRAQLLEMKKQTAAGKEAVRAQALQQMDVARGATLALVLLCGAVCVLVIAHMRRTANRVLGGDPAAARAALARIALGHLDEPGALAPGDQTSLMAAVEQTRLSLSLIVAQVRTAADSIATGSNQILIGNDELSGRTEAQASSLQQTAASMEQMTATVKSNAAKAGQADDVANRVSEVAGRGGVAVSRVVATMDQIQAASTKIADIVGVVDGIAFQTNILALNAAVEAARAGEQGRGFAVVASEVRVLAQRSALAAKEIKQLIEASVQRVGDGSLQVRDAGTTIGEVVSEVARVSALIAEISNATREQSTGIDQVNQAVGQLDQMTQQNSALVEQSAAAAGSLKEQAAKLAAVMSSFRLGSGQAAAV